MAKKSSVKPSGNSPVTDRPFMKRLQSASRVAVKASEGEKCLAGLEAAMQDDGPLIEFDRIYKPYVLHVLRNVYHFADTTTSTAEDIYHDVLVDLLGGLLWRFDFDRENVGKGAFRCYLKSLIRSAYFKQVFPELIPALDKNGDPIYLDEYEKDKRGKIKEDEDGRPLRKRKMISRKEFLGEQSVLAKVEGLPAMFAAQKPHEGLSKPVVRLAVIAYIKAIYAKEQKGKARWRLEAMKRVFEDLQDPQKVSEDLQQNGVITDRRAFDTAKSIFMDEWEAVRYALQEPVIETTVGGLPIRVRTTRTGKVSVVVPTVKDGEKSSYSREVRRRLKVDFEQLGSYIKELEKEAVSLVGKDRVDAIGKSVVRAMLLLMQESDAKEAEKRAKHYA